MITTQNFKPVISYSTSSLHNSQFASAPTFVAKPPSETHFLGSISRIFKPQNLLSTTPRRGILLPAVSGLWDALTGGNSSREAALAVRRGMLLFRQVDVLESLAEFDKAIKLDTRQKAFLVWCIIYACTYRVEGLTGSKLSILWDEDLWQRGLSLYYLDRFEEGAEQFRLDVAQNPNDTEESIWCFLCEARLHGVDEARKRFLEVGRDSRPVMREAYNMFKVGGDPEKFAAAFSGGRENEKFYASLYAGLYYESQSQQDAAKGHIISACLSPYGQRSEDYMASLAKVHCKCRNWEFS